MAETLPAAEGAADARPAAFRSTGTLTVRPDGPTIVASEHVTAITTLGRRAAFVLRTQSATRSTLTVRRSETP